MSNERGKIIEDYIICEDIIVLNDGSPTHFSTHKSLTHVDLSLCSSTLAPKCCWEAFENLHGSDHFPILTTLSSTLKYEKIKPQKKFKTDIANWESYQIICEDLCNKFAISTNINQEASKLNKIIRSAANTSIPQTKPIFIKTTLPWWNSNLQVLRKEKQTLWHDFKKNRSNKNLIAYKKAKALFKKASKESKHLSLEILTSKITPNSTPRKIWSDIKMLSGHKNSDTIKFLKTGPNITTSFIEISNIFGSHWSGYSADTNFHTEFMNQKKNCLEKTYTPSNVSSAAKKIDTKVTFVELENSLQGAKGKTPGFDRINYPMIQNLPITVKYRLIELFNNIIEKGIYPQNWRTALIVPIPKPNKPKSEINDFRPISLLSCMAKTFEKIIAKRLMWFITSKNLISHNQVAFKRKQSTTDVLLHLQHYVSNALSAKNHITILATDFEKAFDRIGAHIVLQQLSKWGVGQGTFNVVKAFLTHRHFRVKINSAISKTYPLHNGIPQGSPLSVVLFIIAFEQLSRILLKYKTVEHSIYADDAIIFTKVTDMVKVESIFCNILKDIKEWGKISGANLSIEKCKMLHICKKKNCTKFNLSYDNISIDFVNNINILGIIFEEKFTFKQQCLNLRKSLATRLSIVKYLTSKHCHIHTNTLIQITRSLILSKIEYALPVFGGCAVSHLKLIYKPYHTAVRRSLNAFPTSATVNILAEAGLPNLLDHIETTTYKLIPKLFNSHNAILYKDVTNTINSRKIYKKISTIRRCVTLANDLPLELRPQLIKQSTEPPWKIKKTTFITDLEVFPKDKTPPIVYHQKFLQVKETLQKNGWNFLYTDGSKTTNSTSFSIVHNNGDTINYGILEEHCSIFSAEATAIMEAVKYAKDNKGKFVICSDSRSTIDAVQNIKNININISQIRDICIKHPNKLRLMWVPGHTGIEGNELADRIANEAHTSPCFVQYSAFEKDIVKAINFMLYQKQMDKWSNYNHRYAKINISRKKEIFPPTCTRMKSKIMVRLRIGHTQLTHEHILTGNTRPQCIFCSSSPMDVDHILDDCQTLNAIRHYIFDKIKPSSLLSSFDQINIDKIIKFLEKCNILDKI